MTEHTFICHACPHSEAWTSRGAAQSAAVWHVYTVHPNLWLGVVGGDRAPRDPQPETLGQRLEWSSSET